MGGLFLRWGASFLIGGGGAPQRGSIGFIGGRGFDKNRRIGGGVSPCPLPPPSPPHTHAHTMGNPAAMVDV